MSNLAETGAPSSINVVPWQAPDEAVMLDKDRIDEPSPNPKGLAAGVHSCFGRERFATGAYAALRRLTEVRCGSPNLGPC